MEAGRFLPRRPRLGEQTTETKASKPSDKGRLELEQVWNFQTGYLIGDPVSQGSRKPERTRQLVRSSEGVNQDTRLIRHDDARKQGLGEPYGTGYRGAPCQDASRSLVRRGISGYNPTAFQLTGIPGASASAAW